MPRKLFALTSLLVAASVLLAACGGAATTAAPQPAQAPAAQPTVEEPVQPTAAPVVEATPEPCTITFGAAVSLTGKTAKEGTWIRDGYELYKTKINEAGGFAVGDRTCQIDIKYYDDASDPDTSAQLIEKLVTEDQVNLLLGPYGTNPVFSASAIAEKYEIPMVEGGGAGLKIFDRGYQYIFGTLPAAPNYLRSVLNMAQATDPSLKSVAILVENDGFATEVADGADAYAKELGLEVVYHEQYPKDATDVSSLLTAVKALSPDIILGAGHLNDSILIVKTAKDLGVSPKVMGFSVGPTSKDFTDALGADANYVLGIGPWTANMNFEGDDIFGTPKAFVEAMQAAYGAETYTVVPYQAAAAAAALEAYRRAIEAAGSVEPKAVRDALAALNFESFYGHVEFSPEGIILKDMGVVQINPDGKLYTVYPADAANGEFIYPMPAWNQR